jgi:hypothetical protein
MPEPFAVLDALNQSAPTNFDAVDANMMFKSDENRVATAMDDKLFVRFFVKPVKDEAKSLEAGRTIMEDHVFVNVKIPGDKNNDVIKDCQLEPAYIQRFPVHYERFKRNLEQVVGTPLSALPFLRESQVEEYRAMNIRTVEQLAGLADVQAQTILGSISHKQQAQAWLDSFKGAEQLRKEYEADKVQKEAELAELRAKVEALSKPQVYQPKK